MFFVGLENTVRSVKRSRGKKRHITSPNIEVNHAGASVVEISTHSRLLAALERFPEAKREVLKALTQK